MRISELYQAIFRRKSIRKYHLAPLEPGKLAEIEAYLTGLQPLDRAIQTEFKIVSRQDVTSLLPIQAPHYIVAFSENKPGYLANMGFLLQQLDLYLSASGIGSCWLGIPRPTRDLAASSRLEFTIIMSFGHPAEPLYRDSIAEFKRKPVEKVTGSSCLHQLLEPVRLAPSATNSQPWFFTGDTERIHAYCKTTNILTALIYKKMNQIDMGIALYHFYLAAYQTGKMVAFVQDEAARQQLLEGYYYIGTAELNESLGKN